ncbi:MAG: DNA repair and recombination protein RadB [Nanoarchaeota archaeon]|nr:DNA repair and recombination protein RadB [Nanoarchaeota archaeon]MBU1031180.1 DNA repair and recombination protein RadB [Nanoarchaeota archaeon]MBU1850656.1 DNA repair and recombination protein RadB [Nanoarchaeota archaeon]
MENKISTGTAILDWLLEGGYEKDVLTTIYGPAGSGKTNICLLCLANIPKDKKAIYIDTEGSFSVTRFKQITDDYENILKRVIFLKPTNFEEQKNCFSELKSFVNEKISLIILDSVAMLYRLELGKSKDVYTVNRELGLQLSLLIEIARKKLIPVLITNQVYADFENKNKVNLVGGDILKYQSKCLIELQKVGSFRKAILRKHRSLPDEKKVFFKIVNSGIEEVEEIKEKNI